VYHSSTTDFAGRAKEKLSIDELHRTLGHIAHDAAKDLVRKGLVLGVDLDEDSVATVCEACETAKMTRKPIRKVREGDRATAIGDVIHSDVWGPARWTAIYLMRTKDEAFEHYKAFEAWLKTQYNVRVKVLHSDRGGEYRSRHARV